MDMGVVLNKLYNDADAKDKKIIKDYIESKVGNDSRYDVLYDVIKTKKVV